MPWIVTILMSLFTAFIDFFLKFFTKKTALSLAVISMFISFTAIFITSLTALINTLAMTMPPSMALAVGWFMPPNMPLCFGACMAANTARFVYDMRIDAIKIASYIT